MKTLRKAASPLLLLLPLLLIIPGPADRAEAFLSAALSPAGDQAASRPGPMDVISVLKSPGRESRLRRMGFDLLAEWNGRIYLLAGARGQLRLGAAGIAYAPESGRFPAVPSAIPRPLAGGLNGAYHSYRELEADLYALQARFPDLAKVSSIGKSLEGRDLYALKISRNAAAEENEAKVLFLGCHHAREWISVEVPYCAGKHLLENYASDPEVRRLLDSSEVWIVPLVNPDGLEYSIRIYRYWRKNRRDSGNDVFGVDLNRNYGYKWGLDNEGSSPNPESEVYRGTAAFSEPETQAVRDFFESRDFSALITYHSFAQVIMYPWGYTAEPAPDQDRMAAIGADMAARILAVNGRVYEVSAASTGLYFTNGDTTDWTYAVSGASSYTIELPPVDIVNGGFFNAEADIESISRENIPAILSLIARAVQDFRPSAPNPPDAKPGRDGDRPPRRPSLLRGTKR